MISDYLTHEPGAPRKRDAVAGMAHFAGAGPEDTTCKTCIFFQHRSGRRRTRFGCQKYFELTGRHGPAIDGTNASCRYYEPTP